MNNQWIVLRLLAALMTLPLLCGAAEYYWDLNGATAGSGTPPRNGDWDSATTATSTNWSANSGGTTTTFAWPGNALPAATPDVANIVTYTWYPADYAGSRMLYLVRVVGTQTTSRITANNSFTDLVLTNGTILFQGSTSLQLAYPGSAVRNTSVHLYSDILGGHAVPPPVPATIGISLNAGSTTTACTNNQILVYGKIASAVTNRMDLSLNAASWTNVNDSKIVLMPSSEISDGAALAGAGGAQVIFGATIAANLVGTVEVFSTNKYTGQSMFASGKVRVFVDAPYNQNGAFGKATSNLRFGGYAGATASCTGQLLIAAAGVTIGRHIGNNSGAGANQDYGMIVGGDHTSGLSTFSGNLILGVGAARTKDVFLTAAAGGTVLFSGAISDDVAGTAAPINKIGGGTVILSGNSSSKGGEKVTEGTLLVNGTTGTGAVTVASAATLGGSGTIRGPVTVQSGAYLAPGTNTIGTLAVSNLTFAADSTYRWEGNSAGGDRVNALVGASLPAAMTVTVTRTDSSKLVGVAVLIDSATPITGGDPAGFTIVPAGTYNLRLSGDGKQLQLRPNSLGTAVIIL